MCIIRFDWLIPLYLFISLVRNASFLSVKKVVSDKKEEEDEGRGKWEDVSAAIEFSTGHNEDGGGGGPV